VGRVTRLWPEEAERGTLSAILGAACLDADAGLRVLRRALDVGLHPSCFGLESYSVIFRTMIALADAGLPIDPVSLAAELDRNHEDPRAVSRLRILAAELAPFNSVERHASIVVTASERREIEERAA